MYNISITVSHVKGMQNIVADILSVSSNTDLRLKVKNFFSKFWNISFAPCEILGDLKIVTAFLARRLALALPPFKNQLKAPVCMISVHHPVFLSLEYT